MKKYTILFAFLFITANMSYAGALVDNGDATISDQGTHLMWQKQDDGTTRTWTAAITYCEGLTLAGHTDWRLPTIKELKSIADMTKYSPAINTTYFPGTQSSYYWSSTTLASDATCAWGVNFSYGNSYGDYKTVGNYARCVR